MCSYRGSTHEVGCGRGHSEEVDGREVTSPGHGTPGDVRGEKGRGPRVGRSSRVTGGGTDSVVAERGPKNLTEGLSRGTEAGQGEPDKSSTVVFLRPRVSSESSFEGCRG